jgi:hypothetical protein
VIGEKRGWNSTQIDLLPVKGFNFDIVYNWCKYETNKATCHISHFTAQSIVLLYRRKQSASLIQTCLLFKKSIPCISTYIWTVQVSNKQRIYDEILVFDCCKKAHYMAHITGQSVRNSTTKQ